MFVVISGTCTYLQILSEVRESNESIQRKLAGDGEFLRSITVDSGHIQCNWCLEHVCNGLEFNSGELCGQRRPETPPPANGGDGGAKLQFGTPSFGDDEESAL